jgi:IMP cyclohydrolase
VVRSADVCSITGAAFTGFYNQSEGTFLSQTTKTSTNTNAFVVSANNNSFNEDVDLRYSAVTQAQALVNVSNVNQITGFARTITSGSSVKQALAYKLNDFAYSVDVTAIFTDTTGSIPTVSQLNIGNTFNNSLALNGHIASIRYFKKRLANAKLQAITA